VDILIVHPVSDTLRGKASKEMGVAVRDEAKRHVFMEQGAQGDSFVPFSVES
jgi:hypothetical protein